MFNVMSGAFEKLARLTKKGVDQIHEKGTDAFVVMIGGFGIAAFDKVERAQDRARRAVDEGWQRQQIRVKRVRVPSSKV